jgi:hypothetical protein
VTTTLLDPSAINPAVVLLDREDGTLDSFPGKRSFTYSRCPRRTGEILLSPHTGECRPSYCAANWCPFCCHVRARLIGRALGRAQPDALVTLTMVGDTWVETITRMRALGQTLRRRSPGLALAWTVESAFAGRHVHALVHGTVPDRAAWSEYAQRTGMGRQVDVRKVQETPVRVGGYLMKGLDKHPSLHLRLNGGRAVHASRNYWRVDGQPVKGMRAAMRASRSPARTARSTAS